MSTETVTSVLAVTRKPATVLLLVLAGSLVVIALVGPRIAACERAHDITEIDGYVEGQMRAHGIPGLALAIIEGGEVVDLRGYGHAGPSGRPMTPETPVIIGSMSKAFTALAVMQLVDAGRVELDAPVQRYVPWFTLADSEASAVITVRHLLNQTSGIPNAVGLAQCLGTGEATIEETVRGLGDVAPSFPAGERFEYSNANYTVLGVLVEAVSGESYREYVRRHVFEPLQMRHSFASRSEAEEHGLATGYRRWFGLPVPAGLPYLQHGLPSGYLISSAEDVAHFLVAHMNGGVYGDARVLSAAGVDALLAPSVETGDVAYGMGWVVGEVGGVPAVYHHGSVPDFHSTMLIEPAGRRGVVVLTNVNLLEMWHVGPSRVIAESVLHMLRGEPAPVGGLSVRARYVIADLVMAALTALVVLHVALVPRWRRQLVAQPPKGAVAFARRVLLPILIDLSWSLTILIAFPDISNLPSWAFWTLYQPDFAYWLLAVAAITVVKGVVCLVWSYGPIRQAIQSIGWPAVVAAAAAVEVILLAVFFGVMMTATNTATFVAGLLAAVLVLELLAHPVQVRRRGAARPNGDGSSAGRPVAIPGSSRPA